MRRPLVLLGVLTALMLSAQPAWAVSGAGYTTVNTTVDGKDHCKNGNPAVNCNIYDGKQYVWLNGGPAANGLGPDGQYFFAVLAPGGQPNPNDGGAKNLSDDYDAYTNRTFTVTNGEVSAYGGTHDKAIPFIRLLPYADTTNPGGVYIMAICSLGAGYPVVPKSCKYDAFKVQKSKATVQAVLSGKKYLDANKNGQFDTGETGLADWLVHIVGSDGTNVTVKTDKDGLWSYTTDTHAPAAGTTSYTIAEVQQTGWLQTGNTVNQSIGAGGASATLSSFVYTVTVPNDAVSAVEELDFGNFRSQPPVCTGPTYGTDSLGREFLELIAVADQGIASIDIVWQGANEVTINPSSYVGSHGPVAVRATQVDPTQTLGLTFTVTDFAGNVIECDPVAGTVERSAPMTFTGLAAADSKVTIMNGDPGARSVEIVVNGVRFNVGGLADGETRQIDISSAMLAGNANVVSVTARGKPGASAGVIVGNL